MQLPVSTPPLKKAIIYAALLFLAACAEKTPPFTGVKIGKPYEINGKTYYPAPDPTYDKIGDASWYGPGFHGKRTASGEVFNQNDITAAHPTLPLPSLVHVTNLSNDKSIVVRVNDRGPYHSNRIIDLSKKSAEMIGLKSTKPVRVRFLARETEDYLASIKGASPKIDMVAYNEEYNEKAAQRMKGGEVQLVSSSGIPLEADSNGASGSGIVENFAPLQTVTINDLDTPPAPAKTANFLINEAQASEIPAQPAPVILRENPVTQQSETTNIPVQKPTPAKVELAEAGRNKFIILAGSFTSEANARRLSNSLVSSINHESNVSVDKTELNGKNWWRVHIGPFSDRGKTDNILGMVHKMGLSDARVSRQK